MKKLNKGMHRFTDIYVVDEPGAGGACHEYCVCSKTGDNTVVRFQNGPVKESESNGCFMEDLLQICVHRLESFQVGDFACRENALALTKIQEALHWLNHRTADRIERDVEGKTEV